MAQNYLYEYGKKLLEDIPDIKKHRKIFYFDVEDSIENIISDFADGFEVRYVERESGVNFEMCWHQDDISLHKNSKKHCQKYNFPKYKFYCKETPPIYTILLYYSTIDEDFRGGEFCFVDEEIRPKSGMGLIFDSKEIHRVKSVKSGTRKVIIIKLYSKNDSK